MAETRTAEPALSSKSDPTYEQVLEVIYQSIASVNSQLRAERRLDKSPATALFGSDGRLDSLGLANLIVTTEQKLEDYFGFRVDLTQDDPFSPQTGHFRTVQSLAIYACEVATKRGKKSMSPERWK